MNKTLAFLMLCLVAGSSMASQYPNSAQAAPMPSAGPDELRYPVHVDALREEFRATGTVTLLVPQLGQVVVTGQENELTSHGNRSMDLPHIHILGGVAGYMGSSANILLGEYGVYGTVEIPQMAFQEPLIFDFDAIAVNDAGGFEQWVGIRDTTPETEDGNLTVPQPTIGANEGNETGNETLMDEDLFIGGLNTPEPQLMGTMHVSTTTETYRDDDDEMDSWYDFDYSDDVAEKRLYLPYDALTDAVSAQLHVYARAAYCSGATGTPHEVFVGAVGQGANGQGPYNACNRWTTAAFGWSSFDVSVNSLVAGATNRFVIMDYGSSWNDRDHHFAMDTDTDFGRSDAKANGNDKPGELMWYLTIQSVQGDSGGSPGCSGQNPTGSLQHAESQDTGFRSTSYSARQPPNPCQTENTDCSGGYGVSWVTYHADKWFVDAHSNWRDRILDAFAQYQPMWQELCITLRAWPVETGVWFFENNSTNCNGDNNVREQYTAWLTSSWQHSAGFWDDDAYQLWTGAALEGSGWGLDGWWCFGTANADRVNVGRTTPAFDSVSVIEAYDWSTDDRYDPDEKHERGVVSGHEMAHVYGEENHPYHCKKDAWYRTPYDCNIMRRCKDPDFVVFYFTPESKREIMFRYHYAAEVDSGNEGKADCP